MLESSTPEAVGAEQHARRRRGPSLDDAFLQGTAVGAEFGEARGDPDDGACPGGEGVVDGLLEPRAPAPR